MLTIRFSLLFTTTAGYAGESRHLKMKIACQMRICPKLAIMDLPTVPTTLCLLARYLRRDACFVEVDNDVELGPRYVVSQSVGSTISSSYFRILPKWLSFKGFDVVATTDVPKSTKYFLPIRICSEYCRAAIEEEMKAFE
jgi:hypothetical protein